MRRWSLILLLGRNSSKKSNGKTFRDCASQSTVSGTPTDGPSPTVIGSSITSTSEKDTLSLRDDEEEGDKFADAKEVVDELRLRHVREELSVVNDMSMAQVDCGMQLAIVDW